MLLLFKIIPKLIVGVLGAGAVLVGYLTFLAFTRPEPVFPEDKVRKLIESSSIKASNESIIIITGSTGGLGLTLAEELYRLGLTVIIASRTESKCKQVVQDLESKYPNSKGKLDYGVLDTGDLESVRNFCNWFKSKYPYLTVLFNNAGQHYMQGDNPMESFGQRRSTVSKQGYDEVFAINYLGHFLLTHLLLPTIKEGKVINVASAYHFGTNGSTLVPKPGKLLNAANGENRGFDHRNHAYAVTKLAQVLHTRELHRRLQQTGQAGKVKSLVVCPGWVRTGMIPKGAVGAFLNSFNFTPKCGTLVMLSTIFDNKLKGGEWSTNYNFTFFQSPIGRLLFRLSDACKARFHFVTLAAVALVVVEAHIYGYYQLETSLEGDNEKLAKDLYDWTVMELQGRGYIESEKTK